VRGEKVPKGVIPRCLESVPSVEKFRKSEKYSRKRSNWQTPTPKGEKKTGKRQTVFASFTQRLVVRRLKSVRLNSKVKEPIGQYQGLQNFAAKGSNETIESTVLD